MSHYINELFDRLEHYEEIIERLEALLVEWTEAEDWEIHLSGMADLNDRTKEALKR